MYAPTVEINLSYTILMWNSWRIQIEKAYFFFIKDELHSSGLDCWVILRSLHLFDYDKHILWLLQLSIGITVVWTSRIEYWYSYKYALDIRVPGNFLRAFVYSKSNPISSQSKLIDHIQPKRISKRGVLKIS